MTEYLRDVTIAQHANIRVGRLSGFLTGMLVVNGAAIALSVIAITRETELCRVTGSLFALTVVAAIVLYFATKRFLSGLTTNIPSIDASRMEMICRLAKRFYTTFTICLLFNTAMAFMGAIALVLCLVHA